ncbi:ABC transporter substrate-binding protein [Klebsiella pneumoniae]|nr:ABC transporter substrate-binding protein [Klebsiella pneumoniae]
MTASRCISNPAASWRYWALPAAAKSTLLRLLAGLSVPASGEIRFGDRLVARAGWGLPPEQRDIGMVFQDYALWPHMSVAQNVAFPLRMRGVSRSERERRVSEALARGRPQWLCRT